MENARKPSSPCHRHTGSTPKFKLTALATALALIGSAAPTVGADYSSDKTEVNPQITADNVQIGTKDSPVSVAVSIPMLSNGVQSYIHTVKGGSIDIFGHQYSIRLLGSSSFLEIGSSTTSSLNISTTQSPGDLTVNGISIESNSSVKLLANQISIRSEADNTNAYGITTQTGTITVGSADTAVVDISATSTSGNALALQTGANASTTINGKTITLSSSKSAFSGSTGSTTAIGSDATESLWLQAVGGQGALIGGANGQLDLQGKTITIDAATFGIKAQNGSTASVKSDVVSISSGSDASLIAYKGNIDVNAKTLNIISSQSDGIAVQGNDENLTSTDRATVNIVADSTSIRAHGAGLMATSGGILNINDGDLTIDASEAIVARGNAQVNINQGAEHHNVVMNGNIAFVAGNDAQSGSILNADINIKLSGEQSSWTGSLLKLDRIGASSTITDGLTLELADGARWNAAVYHGSTPEGGVIEAVPVETLILNGGVVATTETGQRLEVNNLEGSGGTVDLFMKETDADYETATFVVNEDIDQTTKIRARASGITADVADARSALMTMAQNMEGLDEVELAIDEGNIKGAVSAVATYAGDEQPVLSDVVQAKNTKLMDFSGVNAISLVQWRNEINHLTKRLGDLRATTGELGAWARIYGGESGWSNDTVEMNALTVQVGSDMRLANNWIVGGAFSYTDSSLDLYGGEAEGDAYSLSAYASYLADNGVFYDMIARYGYLKNEIQTGNMAIDTASNAFSLSVEAGHHFTVMDRGYLEPQIELTYGMVLGDDATASNGVRIEQDDFESLVGRVGFRVGFDFPEKAGTFYAMASYHYEFLGDAKATASQNNVREKFSETLDGGWISYGIGANFQLSDTCFAYGELERTSGGDVDNPYLFNVGIRKMF